MSEKKKMGRKQLDLAKRKKMFPLYLSEEQIQKAGGPERVKYKAYKAILGNAAVSVFK